MTIAFLLVGAATIYAGPYVGQPLYCDRGEGLIYSRDAAPWVAVDVSEFTSGRVQCGDEMLLLFPDGRELRAMALDAGPLYPYRVDQWDAPIVVDVPAHLAPFAGLSAPVVVVNVSAIRRRWEREMIFEILYEAAQADELILLDGALCHWHLCHDGQLTIREIIVLPGYQRQGLGTKILEQFKAVPGTKSIFAKCPADLSANSWYEARGFELVGQGLTGKGRGINLWRFRL